MRTLLLLAAISVVVAIACGDAGSSAPTPMPTATAWQLSPQDILRESDHAMNRLESLRVRKDIQPTVAPGQNPPTLLLDEYVAPDRARHVLTSTDGDLQYEVVVIGSHVWTRTGLNQREERLDAQPFSWPEFDQSAPRHMPPPNDPPTANAELLREETLGDQLAWVVTYSFKEPSHEGPFDVFVTEWIAKSDFRLLRRELHDNDPFGVQARVTEEFFDFDASIAIRPPVNSG